MGSGWSKAMVLSAIASTRGSKLMSPRRRAYPWWGQAGDATPSPLLINHPRHGQSRNRIPVVVRAAQVGLALGRLGTRVLHRVALGRVLPILGARRVDTIDAADVADLVNGLAAGGYKRETISKSITALAQVFDHAGVDPNPVRSKQIRLPREEREEPDPPTADHVEAVYRLLPSKHRLAFLFLDWSAARVAAVDSTLVSDYDEPRRRVQLRRKTTKTRKPLWIELPPALADAIESTLPPREDRNPSSPLFLGCSGDRLRTAIARACKATGTPLWSPHDLRHRRISLLHRQGRSWAEIARFVGQRKLSLTADTYTHVLIDGQELHCGAILMDRSPFVA
jgi:integrase